MDFTIVPTSGKPVKFASPKAMNAEPVRIECVFHEDARLLEGIALLVSHAALGSGIAEKEAAKLAQTALDECRKVFSKLPGGHGKPKVRLLVTQFRDRVEVTVEHGGEPPFGNFNGAAHGTERSQVSDRLTEEGSEGNLRITFTTYCAGADSSKQK